MNIGEQRLEQDRRRSQTRKLVSASIHVLDEFGASGAREVAGMELLIGAV